MGPAPGPRCTRSPSGAVTRSQAPAQARWPRGERPSSAPSPSPPKSRRRMRRWVASTTSPGRRAAEAGCPSDAGSRCDRHRVQTGGAVRYVDGSPQSVMRRPRTSTRQTRARRPTVTRGTRLGRVTVAALRELAARSGAGKDDSNMVRVAAGAERSASTRSVFSEALRGRVYDRPQRRRAGPVRGVRAPVREGIPGQDIR